MGMYIQVADVQARLSKERFLRIFDLEGDSAPDPTYTPSAACLAFCNRMILDAESEVNMAIRASFPQFLNFGGAVVDAGIINRIVAVTCYFACKFNPSAQGQKDAPFLREYEDSIGTEDGKKRGFFRRLSTDTYNRLVTSFGGPPKPQTSIDNTTLPDGTPNGPYTRVADQTDPSNW